MKISDVPFGTTAGIPRRPLVRQGAILLCLEGRLDTKIADGRTFVLTPGVSYQVADHAEAHRSSTDVGAKLFIVD